MARRSARQSLKKEAEVINIVSDDDEVLSAVPETPSPRLNTRRRVSSVRKSTADSSASTPATGRSSRTASTYASGSHTPATSIGDEDEDEDKAQIVLPTTSKARISVGKSTPVSAVSSRSRWAKRTGTPATKEDSETEEEIWLNSAKRKIKQIDDDDDSDFDLGGHVPSSSARHTKRFNSGRTSITAAKIEDIKDEILSDLDSLNSKGKGKGKAKSTISSSVKAETYSDDDTEEDIPLASWVGAGSDLESDIESEDEDENKYETTKQRAKRLKSEKYKARLKVADKRSMYDKNLVQILKHHPELTDVWEDLANTVPDKASHKADQPRGLTINLLPFQLEGLHWLTNQEKGPWKGGMLADEMGMGKTIQMISLMLVDRQKPCLVVAPTVAIMQWRNEVQKYTDPNLSVIVWHGATRTQNKKAIESADVVLTSYAVLESCFRKQESGFRRKHELIKEKSVLHSIHWRRIILDEAHNIKERATNTAKGAFALQGDFRWCLSGTPLQNRVGELYSMIRFLGGDPYAYYYCKKCPCKSLHWSFKDRKNCDSCGHTPMHHTCYWNNEILKPIQRSGTGEGEGADAFKRLRLLLDHVMLRRTKLERADDMGLPPRTIEVRRDLFNEEEEDLYTSLYSDTTRKFSTYLAQGTVLNNYSNIFTLLTRMRQLANHPDLVLRSKTGVAAKLLGDDEQGEIHVCRLCNDEAEDAIKSQCKHIFCRECVRQYLDSDLEYGAVPDCPYCHATLTIDLEGEALEPPISTIKMNDNGRQGILARLDMDKWRSSTKIEALVEELTQLRTEDKTIKSLVFSQFVSFLDLIAFRLQRAGFLVCRLEGNMSPEARNKTIKYFMENPSVTVFLVSLKAGGVALNLTEASRVYLMDPWWNPSVEVQAMDRIHRLGQHRPIIVKRMVIENSIESRIIELQNKKSAMIEAALSKDDSAMGRLSVNDLRFLFTL